ncbi:alpha/beta fold hydrolase [Sphingomonas histidinilytica]|jgi:haloacetate dehalogenase|uniref:alpha/beta fold hydrolase n=1 Tax=Rhizorhabdus histidinilytica TaxID=439228 RepID=UPI001AD9D182|nr:alpha/beta hydrolase [Rhizorhabdus histidinilytica]MBO9379486.1 alpha/beta fold hydrolase [Rhizorhabdus histidinilytica]
MVDGSIEGFARRHLPGEDIEVDALVGGSGRPLLLLHGWPQTRMCWSAVAPGLAEMFTVVMPDLRGYGRSGKPEGGDQHAAYSKRAMAQDQILAMKALGFDRFAVGAHDRGARVAYRLALDYPEVVTRLASLDVVPTADVWNSMGAKQAVATWHWPFLAQPDGLPEKLIGADPEWFVRYILEHQSAPGFEFPEQNVADYVACAQQSGTVRGWCEDYRAGWGIDRELDEADRGRKLAMPLLVLWGEQGSLKGKDGVALWRPWASQVEGEVLPCGHFIPEEQPHAVAAHFLRFFGEAA